MPSRLTFAAAAFAAFALVSGSLGAHEFWVQPHAAPLPGGEMMADLRRGENFRGDPLVFNPANFERFDVTGPEGTRPVEGRLGDKPALRMEARAEGLYVAAYVSPTLRTTYTAAEQFQRFAEAEGFEDAARRHDERVQSPVFSEAYTRYAKALVPVGQADVADRTLGLPVEIVLEDMAFDGGRVRARVFLFGQPFVHALVRRFARPLDDDAAPALVETARTDAWGRVTLDLPPGHRILLSAVHLREPSTRLAAARDVVWETLWASSAFDTRFAP